MYSGASTTSLIRRASVAQSSSPICPVRMLCRDTRDSADSSRIVISFRLISRLKITVGRSCLNRRRASEVQGERGVVRRDHAPTGQVQLVLVVYLDAPDRAAESTGRTSTMNRHLVSCGLWCSRSLCFASWRGRRKTWSGVVKLTM